MIKSVRVGAVSAEKLYLGDNLVWQRKTPIPSDYILRYDFDGDTVDKSINGLNGIKTGLASFTTGRKTGTQCMSFAGGCVYTAANVNVASDKVSLSFWLKVTTIKTALASVLELSQDAYTDSAFGVFLNNTNAGGLDALNTSTSGATKNLNVVTTDNAFNSVWTHYVVTIDRSASISNESKIYVNNTLASRATTYSADTSGNFPRLPFYMGQRSATQYPFFGLMQDVRLYSRILTADERTKLFNE